MSLKNGFPNLDELIYACRMTEKLFGDFPNLSKISKQLEGYKSLLAQAQQAGINGKKILKMADSITRLIPADLDQDTILYRPNYGEWMLDRDDERGWIFYNQEIGLELGPKVSEYTICSFIDEAPQLFAAIEEAVAAHLEAQRLKLECAQEITDRMLKR